MIEFQMCYVLFTYAGHWQNRSIESILVLTLKGFQKYKCLDDTNMGVLVFRIPVKSRCCPSSTMNVIQNTVGETMSKYLYVLVAICNFEAKNRALPFKWRNALFLLGRLRSFVCVARTSKVCVLSCWLHVHSISINLFF